MAEPPSSSRGMLSVGSANLASLLLSYGLEGYFMGAVDVRVDVEALICRCCSAFSGCFLRDLAFQPPVTVSSLILGEVESGDLGELAEWKGLASTRMSYPLEWIPDMFFSRCSTANQQYAVCSRCIF